MKHLPPLKSLQYFLVTGESKNFKEAAEQLNVTQAAVSQQILLLEENLQEKLFERTNKKQCLLKKVACSYLSCKGHFKSYPLVLKP